MDRPIRFEYATCGQGKNKSWIPKHPDKCGRGLSALFVLVLSATICNLSDWLTVDKLQFHPLKTKLMVVGSTYN